MEEIMKKLLMVLALVLGTSVSHAASGGGSGFGVGVSYFMYNLTLDGDNFAAPSESKNSVMDIKLGYLMSNGLYLGALSSSASSNNGTGALTGGGLAAALGYHMNGFMVDLNYFLSGTQDYTSTTKYTSGSGIGLDFGYNHMLSSSFYLGVELSYKSLSFAKSEVSGTETTVKNTVVSTMPMLNLGFMF